MCATSAIGKVIFGKISDMKSVNTMVLYQVHTFISQTCSRKDSEGLRGRGLPFVTAGRIQEARAIEIYLGISHRPIRNDIGWVRCCLWLTKNQKTFSNKFQLSVLLWFAVFEAFGFSRLILGFVSAVAFFGPFLNPGSASAFPWKRYYNYSWSGGGK